MKKMKMFYKYFIIIGLISFGATSSVLAQKKKSTRIKAEYLKRSDKTESLVTTLMVREKRYQGLSGATIQFYSINDTSRIFLRKMQTNQDGQAFFTIEDTPEIFKDSSGLMTFEIEYDGSNSTKTATKKISFKRSNLDISFFKKDDIKFIEVDLTEIGENDQVVPIDNISVLFYVKGTFSLYNFGKEKTDELGKANIEFPVDMPGDTVGVLTIVVKVDDNKTYGTIESDGEMNWGIPLQIAKEKHRGLGDTDAPLWMVYTLIILLSAVWFHFFYVIFMIVRIKLAR